MAGIFIFWCTGCRKEVRKPHNRPDWKPIQTLNDLGAEAAKDAKCSDCQLLSSYYQKKEKEKKEQEQKKAEKERLSKCHQCETKIKGNYLQGEVWVDNFDKIKASFCSHQCYEKLVKEREEQKKYFAEVARKWKEEQLEATIKKAVKMLSKTMENGEDISEFDWENVDWLNEEQKEICRKYVKNRKNVEELKRQKDNLEQQKNNNSEDNSTENNDSSENEKTCAKCGQRGTKYNIPSKNDDKEFCSKTCCADYYYYKEKSSDSSVNTKKNDKCDKCSKEISKSEKSYYADVKNKTGTLCRNCLDKELDEEEIEDNNSQKENIPSKKKKPVADTLKTGKDLVRQGYKFHEIDTSRLSESQKTKLNDFYLNFINKNDKINPKTEEPHREWPYYILAGIVWIGILSLIIWGIVAVIRKKKKKK